MLPTPGVQRRRGGALGHPHGLGAGTFEQAQLPPPELVW